MNFQPLRNISAVAALILTASRRQAGTDVSGATACPPSDWLHAGIIYEILPRDFSTPAMSTASSRTSTG